MFFHQNIPEEPKFERNSKPMKTKQQIVKVKRLLFGQLLATVALGLLTCLFVLGTFTARAAESCPRTTIKFSEICYWPSNGQPQWVELFNTGTESVDARGMELVSGTNSYSLPLGLAEVPTNGFILVYFDGGGTDDASFATTNLAVLHSTTTNFLGNPTGSVSLYQVTGIHSRDTLVDYLAWGAPPGTDAAIAIQKGRWSSTNSFLPTDESLHIVGPFVPMTAGGSLDLVGGVWVTYDQSSITPGAPNALITRPYIDEPQEGEWSDSGPAWYRWVWQPAADHFELQVATDSGFTNLVWDLTNLMSTPYLPGTNSLPMGTNWCRVRSFSPDGSSSQWSLPISFKVGFGIGLPPVVPSVKKKAAAASENTIQGQVVLVFNLNARPSINVALPYVNVSLMSGTTVVQSTTTDANGNFTLTAPNGSYTIVSSSPNYNFSVKSVTVNGSISGLIISPSAGSGYGYLSTPIIPLGAKKDTPLLQVKNDGSMMCDKDTNRDQVWDQPHNRCHPEGGALECYYCWAVSATMIARHAGGTLFDDEVVNEVKQMAYGADAGASEADEKHALRFVFKQTDDSKIGYTESRFTESQIANAINSNLPIYYDWGGHLVTIDGYYYINGQMVCHFVNVDNNAGTKFIMYRTKGWWYGAIPNAGLTGKAYDSGIWNGSSWVDTDSDGVLDFDEIRFKTDKTKSDTDGDGIPDKIEIASWAFPRDGVGGNIRGKLFAIDTCANAYAAQYTADTDGGGLKDGDEDTDHNGISGKWDTAHPGETDVFDPSDDKAGLDLVFCIDTTGSMSPYIAGVGASMISTINSLSSKYSSYRVAIVGYKDYPDQKSAYLNYVYSDFTTNIDDLINATYAAEDNVGGGGDTPEAVYSGIIECITDPALGGWRPDPVKRSIIVMGDAPAHDPEEDGTTLANVQAAAASGGPTYNLPPALSAVVKALAVAKGVLSVDTNTLSSSISVFPVWEGSDPTAGASWTNIALATGGSVVPAPSGSDVGPAILTQIDAIKASTTASLIVTGPSGQVNVRGLTNIIADASKSFDPNGCGIIKYEWDWNNDGIYEETSLGPIDAHSYPGGLTNSITVRITTVGGEAATASFILPVLPATTVAVQSQILTTNIDRQTGLYYDQVVVTNSGSGTLTGFRISATNLPANVWFVSATGTNAGIPYVDFTTSLAPGGTLKLNLAFYSSKRQAPVGVAITVAPVTITAPTLPTGDLVAFNRSYVRPDGKMAVEFKTGNMRVYVIEYSSDMVTWKQAQTPITGNGTTMIWVDSGPPQTDSQPTSGSRFYRLLLLPQ
jgi:hypothetical protein